MSLCDHLIIKTKQLFGGNCIENCANNHTDQYLQLPKETFKINQLMCEERWNRTGRLCGKCLPGHSPLAYSYDMRCVKCPEGNRNVWKYILLAFGPLTLFYFLVLFLKINANSSYLHGYLIFSQIISAEVFARLLIGYRTKSSTICTNVLHWDCSIFCLELRYLSRVLKHLS